MNKTALSCIYFLYSAQLLYEQISEIMPFDIKRNGFLVKLDFLSGFRVGYLEIIYIPFVKIKFHLHGLSGFIKV